MEVSGGGAISEVFQGARRLLLRVRDGLERLERLQSFSSSSSSKAPSSSMGIGADPPELSFNIKKDISEIRAMCVEMDGLWRSLASKAQRDLWKRKLEQVAEEVESLQKSLDRYSLQQQKRIKEAIYRAELLERVNGDSEYVLKIFDDEAQAMQSARNSSIILEEAYATGIAVLSKYAEQRDRLKIAQRKALDILNTVGLSNSVLKLIERRHHIDKWIAYAGMIITIVVVYAFWRLMH